MSIQFKEYREVSRKFLLRVLEKQKEDNDIYPVSLFSKNLEDELRKSGFKKTRSLSNNFSSFICSNQRCQRLMK